MGFGLYAIAFSESPTFFADTMTGTGPSNSDVRNPSSLLAWNVSRAVQLNTSIPSVDYDISGWGFTRWRVAVDAASNEYLWVDTFDRTWGIYDSNEEDFAWTMTNGTVASVRVDVKQYGSIAITYDSHLVLPMATMDSLFFPGVGPPSVGHTYALNFTLSNSKTSLETTWSFDSSSYVYPSDGLHGEGIFVSITQDFSDRKTSINLLSFIGGLFAFSTPGVPYPISTVLSMIWWGCVAALSYIMLSIIRSFIPLLGGGD